MASLVESVISLEKEADLLLEEARAAAQIIVKETDREIDRYREELEAQLAARLSELSIKAERSYEDSLAAIERKKSEKLNSLKKLSDDYILLQANKIIDRFNNW